MINWVNSISFSLKGKNSWMWWLSLLVSFLLLECGKPLPDKQLWDYIHFSGYNETFIEADKCKLNGDFKSARLVFQKVLKVTSSFTDSLYSISQLAYIDTKLQQMDSLYISLDALQKLMTREEEVPIYIQGDYHYSMVSISLFDGNVTKAFAHMDSTFLFYNQVYPDKHWKLIQANNTYGHLLFDFNLKMERAFEPWNKAYFAAIPLKAPEHLKAEIYITMIWYNFAMRNIDNANEFADLAIYSLNSSNFTNPDLLSKALCAKAMCLKYKAQYHNAHELFKEALALSQEVNSMLSKRVLNELLHNYYRMEEQPELSHYDSLMFTYEHESPRELYLFKYQQFGLREYIQGNLEKSALHYEKLLELWFNKQVKLNSLVLMEALYILAIGYQDEDNIEKSIQWSYRKLGYFTGVDDVVAKNMVYYPVDTLQKFKNSFISTELLARQFYLQFQYSGNIEHLRRAGYYYNATDQLFLKGLISNDQSSIRTFFNDMGYQFYTDAIKVHLALKESDPTADPSLLNDQIFSYFEKLKSHLWLRGEANKDEISLLSQSIDQLVWKNARYGLTIPEKKDLTNLKIQYLVTTDSIQRLNSMLSVDDYFFSDYSLNEIKRVLTKDDILISYNLFDNRIQIAALTLDSLVFSDIVYGEELSSLDSLRSCLVSGACPYERFFVHSTAVRKILLDPIKHIWESKYRLIIVPDRNINLIPFEVLLEDSLGSNYSDASFLIKSKEVIYTPSCKVYSRSNKVKLQTDKLTGFYYGDDLGGLPCAKYEISTIEKLFPGKQSHIFHSGMCNIDKFLYELEAPNDIMHISLHARSTDLSIFDNYILFGSELEDTLFGFELSHKNIKADLVVLSACESGYGYYKEAEGMYSLTRYIQQAGASRVLSSLWVVDDCIASKIMQTFYETLKVDSNPGMAIRTAKLKYLSHSDELMAFPGYWAAMILVD